MATLWFILVGLMLTRLRRAGRLRPRRRARCTCSSRSTDEERRRMPGAIGPVWDGNEVWLIAGGGVLFFAFPAAYAAASAASTCR